MKKIYSVISFLCLAFIWAGCGSGGGGGGGGATTASTPPAPAPAPTLTESASGIWTGTIESTVANSACDPNTQQCVMVGIVDENNVLRFFNITTGDQYSGTVYGSGNTISSTITFFPPGSGSAIAAMQITGTVDTSTNPKTMIIQYSGAGDTGSMNLSYEPTLYERPSALALVSTPPIWSMQNAALNVTDTLSIDNGGVIDINNSTLSFDMNNLLCPVTGSIQVIDSSFNAYFITIQINSQGTCNPALDGNFSGLAFLSDVNALNDVINIYISRSDAAIMAQFSR